MDVQIDSVAAAADTTTIFLEEGCLYRLDVFEVEVDADPQDNQPGELMSAEHYRGEPVTNYLITRISAEWLSVYEEEGRLLGELKIHSIQKNQEQCEIAIAAKLTPGDQQRVQGIRFEGIVRNDPDYLRRVTGIRSGDLITPDVMERGRQNLINSGLFDDVSEGELIFVDDEPHILYSVQEQQLNFFDGLIGYSPEGPGGGGRISGYGDILLRNTIAEGNLLELRYEQLQPLVSKLNVRAEQQYIAGMPLRAGVSLNFTQQDTSYLVRDLELQTGYRLLPGFELIGSVRAERSSVAETVDQQGNYDSRATFYGLGFHLRKTDRYQVPTQGYDAQVILERGRKYINDDRIDSDQNRSFNQTILRGDLRGYIPLGRRQVIASRVQGMVLESPQFLISDLFRFGGAESIRGYREDQFRASSVGWGELEGRYLIERNSYIFLFGSYGFYNRPQLLTEPDDQFTIRDRLTSLGFGLAFQSPLGLIKFSYAISPDDDLSNGKVHVGIKTSL